MSRWMALKKFLCTHFYQHILYIIRDRSQIILTVAFVLVGMIFLIPAITEKALGLTSGCVDTKDYIFNVQSHMYNGKFRAEPKIEKTDFTSGLCSSHCSGISCLNWQTTGTGAFGGTEDGYVKFDVGKPRPSSEYVGTVTAHFKNPASGTNTCSVDTTSPDIAVKCAITQGSDSAVKYCIDYSTTPSECKISFNLSHMVLEKKPNSTVQTPPLGKIVSPPHNQSQFTVENKQTRVATTASSIPKTPSSTSGHG